MVKRYKEKKARNLIAEMKRQFEQQLEAIQAENHRLRNQVENPEKNVEDKNKEGGEVGEKNDI